MIFLETVLTVGLIGSLVYCVLGVIASVLHGRRRIFLAKPEYPFISVLKPLAGREPSLEKNLSSFFEQDYPSFELLFAVRHPDDPAVAVLEQLRAEFPDVRTRLIVTGEPPYANAKVFSLAHMTEAASYDWLVMSDSDVRVSVDFLRRLALELINNEYDLATCPYRAVPGSQIWSVLEALGMNTEFWTSALVAKLVEGVRFTVGPTVVAHRKVFDAIPWASLSAYLAEDFVLGSQAAASGFRVDLSRVVIEHHLSDESMAENMRHRLRWARSTRRSRPWGYIGQLLTNPIPLAVLVLLIDPGWWWLFVATLLLRAAVAYATGFFVLRDRLTLLYSPLIPIQDFLSFLFWILGFSGSNIAWRGRRYRVNRDGTFDLIS